MRDASGKTNASSSRKSFSWEYSALRLAASGSLAAAVTSFV